MTATESAEPVADDPEDPETQVTAHQSSPDRTVFTEEGNNDGWISTDLTVSLER